MTTASRKSSAKVRRIVLAVTLAGCAADAAPVAPQPAGSTNTARPLVPRARRLPAPEPALGVADTGIFSDLDGQVQLELPDGRAAARALLDGDRHLLVLYLDGWPVKVYPTGGEARLKVGRVELALRPGDRAELAPLLGDDSVDTLAAGERAPPGDLDGDGIPDPLDVVIGARKAALNGASYGAGYLKIDYPGGDVPRDKGVCTDVVVRAVRNAGLDIQRELHRDIERSPRSYPMVKKANANIDHRRVKTSLPYFQRRWEERSPAVDDPDDPVRPGDVVFFDTFPKRSGPDHVGVVSDRRAPDGSYLVINNWTYGAHTTDLELLSWLPVTHRFRFPSSADQ